MTEHTCTKHEPGKAACYTRHRCRCDACRRAGAVESKRYRIRNDRGLGMVDITPVRAHLEWLAQTGMPMRKVAATVGIHETSLSYYRRHAKRLPLEASRAILAIRPQPGGLALVNSAGTVRRMQALMLAGWPLSAVAERSGINASTISVILGTGRDVTADTAQRIAAAYDDMWDQPAPGPQCIRSRSINRAVAGGWAPALAWDEGAGPHGIDNPKARPYPWKRRDSDRRRSRHDISDLRAAGLTDTEIAHRLGIQPESLQRRHAA